MTQDGINAEQVRHLGKLARLELTSEEVEHYAAQLEQSTAGVGSRVVRGMWLGLLMGDSLLFVAGQQRLFDQLLAGFARQP